MTAYQSFLTSMNKTRSSFEIFQSCNGTTRQVLDSFFVYVEQEQEQARQQTALTDIRRNLTEIKIDAQKRIADYQKEVYSAEKDVNTAEKKLQKSKEYYDRFIELRSR